MSPSLAIEMKDGNPADPAEVVTKALGDFQTALDTRLSAVTGDAGKLADRLDKIEAKMNRPAAGSGAANDNDAQIETKAFTGFVRRGSERLNDIERKSLTVSTDSAGGYLAPPQFGAEVIKLLRQYSPIRNYARVVNIGAAEIKYPRRTTSTAASWVGETADRSASQPAFEQVSITPFELATYVDVSVQLLEDAAYNLEGELTADLAESFGITEGEAFVNGTGVGQPKGIMAATGIAEMVTGNAGGFPASNPADLLISMFHKLPGVHAQNGAWVMNRNTLATLRKFKDAQGRYLVLDGLTDGAPVTLLGRPVAEMIDMDDIGANAYPILFGDLQGYRIIDRVGLSVLRDPYSIATKGQVRIHARRRVGADVTHPDRFIKLKVSA